MNSNYKFFFMDKGAEKDILPFYHEAEFYFKLLNITVTEDAGWWKAANLKTRRKW